MSIFCKYAAFYDDYYKNKNYLEEVKYILNLANKYGINKPGSVLDIGCGTGRHLIHIAKMGIDVVGFDKSEEMIKIAKAKIKKENTNNAKVKVADASNYRDNCKYDLVISMFTVMGFITDNNALLAAIKTARAHLNENGLFIFDCWFGPAVMNILPSTRINQFEMDGTNVIRIVEPINIDPIREVVKTKNTIIQTKNKSLINHVVEFHEIRFFFVQELDLFFKQSNFKLTAAYPFMDPSRPPMIKDWNISIIAKAI